MLDGHPWRRVIDRVEHLRELVGAELPEHLLLLLHVLAILAQRVLLLELLLSEQLLRDVPCAGLERGQGLLVRDLDPLACGALHCVLVLEAELRVRPSSLDIVMDLGLLGKRDLS